MAEHSDSRLSRILGAIGARVGQKRLSSLDLVPSLQPTLLVGDAWRVTPPFEVPHCHVGFSVSAGGAGTYTSAAIRPVNCAGVWVLGAYNRALSGAVGFFIRKTGTKANDRSTVIANSNLECTSGPEFKSVFSQGTLTSAPNTELGGELPGPSGQINNDYPIGLWVPVGSTFSFDNYSVNTSMNVRCRVIEIPNPPVDV